MLFYHRVYHVCVSWSDDCVLVGAYTLGGTIVIESQFIDLYNL